MKVVERKLAEITPYEHNPRKNDGAVQFVVNSIKEFGFKVPIVLDKNGVIVAGHTRFKAAQKIGMSSVPCIIADDLTPEQIKAFRLADNKVAEIAVWDNELLDLEIEEISLDGFDMALFGFQPGEDRQDIDSGNLTPSDFSYKEQYGVIVKCKDENQQEEIYNRLTGEGYECKVVAV